MYCDGEVGVGVENEDSTTLENAVGGLVGFGESVGAERAVAM